MKNFKEIKYLKEKGSRLQCDATRRHVEPRGHRVGCYSRRWWIGCGEMLYQAGVILVHDSHLLGYTMYLTMKTLKTWLLLAIRWARFSKRLLTLGLGTKRLRRCIKCWELLFLQMASNCCGIKLGWATNNQYCSIYLDTEPWQQVNDLHSSGQMLPTGVRPLKTPTVCESEQDENKLSIEKSKLYVCARIKS